ncbi:hypothetical protein OH76DRAFT_1410766 [Lentinus brumalis]|uniref:Uncharacterized protein n=1 Tax=Lentinus brumalis TaxID=2498619 RepID=A0A371CR83_9APHY|nr:hypothetical protein OH76DRAFT_1410766 [Polyporus brumalis]
MRRTLGCLTRRNLSGHAFVNFHSMGASSCSYYGVNPYAKSSVSLFPAEPSQNQSSGHPLPQRSDDRI